MKEPRDTVFLERDLYRRRRVIDAVKLLPLLGMFLFLMPALTLDATQTAQTSTANRMIYFFVVWFCLIAAAFVLSLWLRPETQPAQSDSETADRTP